MFLYNVHTSQKTFALTHKENETQSSLFERISKKSGISEEEKSKATLLYEFEGDRWSLDDDDDLQILLSRFPPSSTPSATLHLQLPQTQAHAHFSNPPAYTNTSPSLSSPSSKLKNKVKSSSSVKSSGTTSNKKSNTEDKSKNDSVNSGDVKPIHESTSTKTSGGQSQSQAQSNLGIGNHTSGIIGSKTLGTPVNGSSTKTPSSVTDKKENGNAAGRSVSGVSKAKSVMSTRSRKSKWGDDNAEPLGDVRKREWEEFHNNNGVRTVMGKINGIPNVRMLLKSGYRHVYVSREFAIKNKIVPKNFGMGSLGYTGLKVIGNVDITVGSKTASHQAYISEESHFDVVLGRSWLERMAIKIDPLDPTSLTYMDSGEPIPCDVVVLKDEKGNVITIT